MRALHKYVILLPVVAETWGGSAQAQTPPEPAPPAPSEAPAQPQPEPAQPEPAQPEPAQPEPPPPAVQPARAAQLSDEQLADLSQAETIEIYDERPDKPFDRDTEVRLTGEQLAARGAVD